MAVGPGDSYRVVPHEGHLFHLDIFRDRVDVDESLAGDFVDAHRARAGPAQVLEVDRAFVAVLPVDQHGAVRVIGANSGGGQCLRH